MTLIVTDSSSFLDALAADGVASGFDVRVEIWGRALYALHDFPFTGIGIGTFDQVIPLLYPYFLIPPGREHPGRP